MGARNRKPQKTIFAGNEVEGLKIVIPSGVGGRSLAAVEKFAQRQRAIDASLFVRRNPKVLAARVRAAQTAADMEHLVSSRKALLRYISSTGEPISIKHPNWNLHKVVIEPGKRGKLKVFIETRTKKTEVTDTAEYAEWIKWAAGKLLA